MFKTYCFVWFFFSSPLPDEFGTIDRNTDVWGNRHFRKYRVSGNTYGFESYDVRQFPPSLLCPSACFSGDPLLRGHHTLSSRWSGVNSCLSSHVTVFDRSLRQICSAVTGSKKPTRGNNNIRSDVTEPRCFRHEHHVTLMGVDVAGGSEKNPIAPFYHWILETRNLRRFLVSGMQW